MDDETLESPTSDENTEVATGLPESDENTPQEATEGGEAVSE